MPDHRSTPTAQPTEAREARLIETSRDLYNAMALLGDLAREAPALDWHEDRTIMWAGMVSAEARALLHYIAEGAQLAHAGSLLRRIDDKSAEIPLSVLTEHVHALHGTVALLAEFGEKAASVDWSDDAQAVWARSLGASARALQEEIQDSVNPISEIVLRANARPLYNLLARARDELEASGGFADDDELLSEITATLARFEPSDATRAIAQRRRAPR